jgi:hypothetical protein
MTGEYHELVATESSEQICAADRRLKARPNVDKHFVTR